MKFGMSLRYTLGLFVSKFHKILMRDDVIMASFKFSPNNSNNVHLMIKMKVTLTDDEGHRRRSKVKKIN